MNLYLRTFRGVPDLTHAEVFCLQDALYLRSLCLVEQAAAQDESVLDRLAVGVVSLDVLPDLQELSITFVPQPLRQLAYDPGMDAYVLAFEEQDAKGVPNEQNLYQVCRSGNNASSTRSTTT